MYVSWSLLAVFVFIAMPSVYASENQSIDVYGQAEYEESYIKHKLTLSLTEKGFSLSKNVLSIEAKTERILNLLKLDKMGENSPIISNIDIYQRSGEGKLLIDHLYHPLNNEALTVAKIQNNSGAYLKKTSEVEKTFFISRKIEWILNDVSELANLVDKVSKHGVIGISSFHRFNEDSYLKTLDKATTNAKKKAEHLAKNLGVTINHVIKMEEITPNFDLDGYQANRGHQTIDKLNYSPILVKVRISFAISSQ